MFPNNLILYFSFNKIDVIDTGVMERVKMEYIILCMHVLQKKMKNKYIEDEGT